MLLVQGPLCKRPLGRNIVTPWLQRCLTKTLHSFPSYLELHPGVLQTPFPIPTTIQVLLSSFSLAPASCQTMATVFLEASSCIRTFAKCGVPFPQLFHWLAFSHSSRVSLKVTFLGSLLRPLSKTGSPAHVQPVLFLIRACGDFWLFSLYLS